MGHSPGFLSHFKISPAQALDLLRTDGSLPRQYTLFANAFADRFPLGDMKDGGYMLYICMFMDLPLTVGTYRTSIALAIVFGQTPLTIPRYRYD
jgi:hypothetical protein